MDTNTLLSFAFSIIASFTNIVHIPPEAVPKSKDDLEVCTIGRNYFPLDVYLKSKAGAEFWIANNAVYKPNISKNVQPMADKPSCRITKDRRTEMNGVCKMKHR